MEREVYRRARDVFLAVCELDLEARSPYLDGACHGEPEVRREVESLLAQESTGSGAALELSEEASLLRAVVTTSWDAALAGADAPRAIGRYRIRERIGEGGFGTVFLAEQTEPVVRPVALKVIKAGMDTRQVIARFEAERQALAMMDHPNIARVLDAGATESGRPFFVMEIVHGEPLTDYCDRERLTLRERLRLFRDVCGAVQHAHQKGIIHRDLKPTNVLVTVVDGRPQPKVIDFGVSKATAGRLTDKTLITELHQLVGTPQYMSPEQAESSRADVDTRSDIYSLGVLLYELLAGSTPLERGRLRSAALEEMQRMIREEEPPRPSQRLAASAAKTPGPSSSADRSVRSSAEEIAQRRGTDPAALVRSLRGDLDWIVMRCLEKDRDRRYATAGALADDIARHLEHEPVLASPPSQTYRLRKFVSRHRPVVAAAATVLLVLLGATGVSVWFGVSEGRLRARAERDRERAQRAEQDLAARADELEQVARFQEEQFAALDAQTMGSDLRADLIGKARERARRTSSADDVARQVADLEQLTAGLDFTGLALGSLERGVFDPALAAVEARFGSQPLVRARLLQSLASTLRSLGLIDAATRPQEEALEIRRRELGADHPDTLDSLYTLASLLGDQGRLAEAEPRLREALDAYRRVLGDEDPRTLVALSNLGLVLRLKGDFAGAEPLYREALEKQRRLLGSEHVDTLTTLNNLGTLLVDADRLSEAESCFGEALETYRRVSGDDAPDTLMAIHNMGGLLHTEGRPNEALPYYREALDGYRRVRGDDHPDTLMALNSIGCLLHDQTRLSEAEPYYREALEGRRRVLGDDHPNTLNSLNNLAGLLRDQGRFTEAEPYYREALEGRRRVLGADHPDTLGSTSNMGWFLEGLGRLEEAEPFYREALEGFRRVLGDQHRDTLVPLLNLANVLLARGRPAEAVELLAPAEGTARRAFGASDGARLSVYLALLGRARAGVGEFAAAEAVLSEAFVLLEEANQPSAAQREQVLTGLVALYEAWHSARPDEGHGAEAEEWRAQLLGARARPSEGAGQASPVR